MGCGWRLGCKSKRTNREWCEHLEVEGGGWHAKVSEPAERGVKLFGLRVEAGIPKVSEPGERGVKISGLMVNAGMQK